MPETVWSDIFSNILLCSPAQALCMEDVFVIFSELFFYHDQHHSVPFGFGA